MDTRVAICGTTSPTSREFHDEFDAWAQGFSEPWAEYDTELADTDDENIRIGVSSASSAYNWDSDKRLEHLDAEGVCAEVLFPNTVPPFFPLGRRHRAGSLERARLPVSVGWSAGTQPVDGRLLRTGAGATSRASLRCS